MDDQQLADALKQYQPGFLPYPVFEQIARIVALPIVEFIPLRTRDGVTEVLLIERSHNDPIFPGLLHTPGTVVRATDINREADKPWPPFERILHDELLDTPVGPHHYVGSQLHASKRGAEQAQLYWVEVTGEPKVGQFYALDALPDNLIESQRTFIEQAVKHYETHR